MSTRSKRIDNDRQLSVFDYLEAQQRERDAADPRPGSMDLDGRLRSAISEAISRCPHSRYGIAARMSELLGHEITKSMLDAWSSEAKTAHRFPAAFLAPFCKAVESIEPLKVLAESLGVFVVPGLEVLKAEVMKIDQDISRQRREKRRRLAFINEVEGK